MPKVRPSTEVETLLRHAPEGIAGELTVQWRDILTGNGVGAASGVGVVEVAAPSGNYIKVLTTPAAEGKYVAQWAHGATEILDDVVWEVLVDAPVEELELEDSYASRSDLDAYLEDGLPEGYDNTYLDKVLVKASKDVDLFANRYSYGDYPLKFMGAASPFGWSTYLTSIHRSAIIEATCAQAEYRLAKGDQFFVERQQYEGEFARTQIVQPRFAPKAAEALRRAGLAPRISVATLR